MMAAKLLLRPQILSQTVTNKLLCGRFSAITRYSTNSTDDDEIDELRNVSRLPTYLRNRMSHALKMTPMIERNRFQHRKGVNADRLRYARFGRESGIRPGELWWTREQLEEVKRDEAEWDQTLQEMWADVAARKKEDLDMRLKKEEMVKAQMERMPQLIEDFRKRLYKRKTVEAGLHKKRDQKAAQARNYFGFDMDVNDPRYLHMEEIQEEEAKQAKKKRRREEKAVRLTKMLTGLDAPTSSKQ